MSRTIREAVSAVMMCAPLVLAVVSTWTLLPTAPPTLVVHIDRAGSVDGTAPTWVMLTIALGLALVAATLGLVGLRGSDHEHRRSQRGLAGGAAVLGLVVWTCSVEFTRQAATGTGLFALPVVLGVFGAILWGVLCLLVTPGDLLGD